MQIGIDSLPTRGNENSLRRRRCRRETREIKQAVRSVSPWWMIFDEGLSTQQKSPPQRAMKQTAIGSSTYAGSRLSARRNEPRSFLIFSCSSMIA